MEEKARWKLAEALSHAAAVWSSETGCVTCNAAFLACLHIDDTEQLLKRPADSLCEWLLAFAHTEDADKLQMAIDEGIEGRHGGFSLQLRLRTGPQSYSLYLLTAERVVSGTMGHARAIGVLRVLETSASDYANANSNWNSIDDSDYEPVARLTIGLDGRIAEWNTFCETLSGMQSYDVIGKEYKDVFGDELNTSLKEIVQQSINNQKLSRRVETDVRKTLPTLHLI